MLKLGIHKTFKGKRLYKEVWKFVAVTKRKMYKVSNKGRIKTIDLKNNKKVKILKLKKDSRGYYYITMVIKGERKNFRVHRLVAETFIPNTDNKPCVDHINTIKTDNRVQNLRWVTHKENMHNETTEQHVSNAIKGRKYSEEAKRNMRIGQEKYMKKIICVETGDIYISIKEASKQTGINHGNISAVCNGKRKTTGGYRWKYVKSN